MEPLNTLDMNGSLTMFRMAGLLSGRAKLGVAAGAGLFALALALVGGGVGYMHSGVEATPPQVGRSYNMP